MNSAQCLAINQTTQDVSRTLIDGFFGTINTELSQQLSALNSAIKAGLGLILEQGKAVTAQKGVMEADYQRISSRYVTLFQDLDAECYKRIYALDKASFQLARNVQKKLLIETNTNISAKSLLAIQDESISKLMILVSRLNRIAHDVLKTLTNYVTQETAMTGLIDSFMLNEELDEKKTGYIPVIWVETDKLEGAGQDSECVVPEYIQGGQKNAISGSLRGYCAGSPQSSWTRIGDEEKSSLDKEFKSTAESSFPAAGDEKDTRVYNMLMELWKNSTLSIFARSPV
jgi:hypothetical protein